MAKAKTPAKTGVKGGGGVLKTKAPVGNPREGGKTMKKGKYAGKTIGRGGSSRSH